MEESMSIEPIFLGVIAGIVLLILGAGIAGFFILRKKKNRAAPPARNDGLPLSPAAFPQPGLALKCVGGVLNGSSYPIADTLCIGTNAAFCQVLYPEGEPGICGIHCKITAANGQAQLFDIDSAGTFINGIPILPNVPYTMPVGSSFCVGSPNNVFVIAENIAPAEAPVPSVHTENTSSAKKPILWIAVVSAAAVIAAVILFLLLGKNRDPVSPENIPAVTNAAVENKQGNSGHNDPPGGVPAVTNAVTENKRGDVSSDRVSVETSAADTYTGVTGKAFAIPDAGFANLVFDGKEQKKETFYRIAKVWGDYTIKFDRVIQVLLESKDTEEFPMYIGWAVNTSSIPWKTGASFDLDDLSDSENENFAEFYKIFGDDWTQHISHSSEDRAYFDKAILTVLELDGDELTFYFYLKLSYDGESHTLEGVGRATLTEYPA